MMQMHKKLKIKSEAFKFILKLERQIRKQQIFLTIKKLILI